MRNALRNLVGSITLKPIRARGLARHVRKPYTIPCNTLAKLKIEVSATNRRFEFHTGFPFDVWMTYIATPLMKVIEARRQAEMKRPGRHKMLPDLYRVYRFSMVMRGNTIEHLCELFGQSRVTTQYDTRLLAQLFARNIAKGWIRPMDPDGREYTSRRGEYGLGPIPHAVYCGDIINCKVRRPTRGHSIFLDHKHKMYSVSFFVLCDSQGFARLIMGGSPGCWNDYTMLYRSQFIIDIVTYVLSCLFVCVCLCAD